MKLKKAIIFILKLLGLYKSFSVPDAISANYISIPLSHDENIKKVIVQNNIRSLQNDKQGLQFFIDDLNDRLIKFRHQHIPFLSSLSNLKNKRILEIGCGSASSTIALAEQGAIITGIDIDADEIFLAKQRLKEFNLPEQTFHVMNAAELDKCFTTGSFDIIIYFASLEHMTYNERLKTLKVSWALLNKGGLLCVFGTPNRLWYLDMHTSLLPFYFWLPDDLAFDYSKFSLRHDFNNLNKLAFEQNKILFYRWGRGVSFHEIEVAIQPISAFDKIYDMAEFLRRYSFIQKTSYKRSEEYRYKRILSTKVKNIHSGFFEQMLDIVLVK